MLGHIIFLGIFYSVLLVIVGTMMVTGWRAARDFRGRRTEAINWQAIFPDLPANERVCRHEFTGEFKQRTCDRAFDCRGCQQHAALIAKSPVEATPDRFYHRGHAWVHPEPDGAVTVGLDPLGAALVAQPEAIELPAPGTRIQVNGAAWHMRKRGADVRILSPLDGVVVATGGPQDDWYLKVQPEGGKLDARHLLRGHEVGPWMTREMERLQASLAQPNQIATMADGGLPVSDIAAAFPEADWDHICGGIFLQI